MSFFWGKTFERDLEELVLQKDSVKKAFFVIVRNRPLKSTASKKLVEFGICFESQSRESSFFSQSESYCNRLAFCRNLKKALATIAVSLNWEVPSYHQTLFVDLEKKTPFTLHHFFVHLQKFPQMKMQL